MEAPLPKGWRGVYLNKYDSTSDPHEHLAKYVTQVNLFSNKDTMLCRIFSISLNGRPYHLTPMALVNLQQGENEPLRSFMARLLNVSVKIHNLNLEVAIHSMLWH
ncbi:hypothetical protein CR513_29982, partial [Mucuna pruriens]